MLEPVMSDVRFALRWLRRSPGFMLVAVVSLAIGIGFNTALFTIVDAVLFRPLPVASPGQLVDVFTTGSNRERFATTSYPDYLDFKAENDVFSDIIGYTPMFGAMNLGDRSRLALGEIVTGNYFQMLGIGAAMGRTLTPDDDTPASPHVAMLSYQYWSGALGARKDVIGQMLKLRGTPYTIVGVAPRGFSGMTPVLAPEMWVTVSGAAADVEPVGIHDVVPSPTGTSRLDRRGDRWLFVRGRLKSGRDVADVRANLEVVMSRLAVANPATNKDRHVDVKRTSDVRFHPAADPMVVPIAAGLMLVVGLVLLIACANVASILLARASGRRKEIAVRLAIGAGRGRLITQLLTEGLALSCLGAVAGVLLAAWLMRVATSISLPLPIPLAFDLHLDLRALAFTLVATLTAGVLAGLAPALKATRANLVTDLRGEAVVSSAGDRRWALRDLLVAGQMAVTALLLIEAGLLTRSLIKAQQADLGFPVHRIALVSMDPAMLRYPEARTKQFWEQAVSRVRTIPGVQSVAVATRVPFSVNFNRWDIWIPGRHGLDQHGDTIEVTRVSPEYFQTIGVPIVQGRAFTDADRPDTPRVAIVNETMARRYWPGESPIGKTFRSRGANGPLFEIVGIAADHKVTTVGEAPTPFIHFARAQQAGSYAALMARTAGDSGALLRDMRRTLLSLEPNLVFVENQTMDDEVGATLFPIRAGAWIVGAVGLVAMLLAAVGLYGVIAYSVARRTREIGIRMALGALPGSVLALVMRQGLLLAVFGLAVGCGLALFASRAVAGALYGIGTGDPLAWGGAAVILLGVAALANIIPAARAARVAPSDALRVE